MIFVVLLIGIGRVVIGGFAQQVKKMLNSKNSCITILCWNRPNRHCWTRYW